MLKETSPVPTETRTRLNVNGPGNTHLPRLILTTGVYATLYLVHELPRLLDRIPRAFPEGELRIQYSTLID